MVPVYQYYIEIVHSRKIFHFFSSDSNEVYLNFKDLIVDLVSVPTGYSLPYDNHTYSFGNKNQLNYVIVYSSVIVKPIYYVVENFGTPYQAALPFDNIEEAREKQSVMLSEFQDDKRLRASFRIAVCII